MIKKNPKIFCGYSDITSLHFALYKKCNLITFYGPTAICEFGETLNLEKYTIDYFFKAVSQNKNIGKIVPSKKWTDFKDLNWLNKDDLKIKRKYKKNKGFEWLKKGKGEGIILGGCITTMMNTKGTRYFPNFKNKILLLETPEGEDFRKGESMFNINAYLGSLRLMGILKEIKGIIFGRGFGYNDDEIKQLKESILFHTKEYNYPILYGVDIAHSDPMITIPLGVKVKLNSEKNLFSIEESGVK